jgi:DASH complex subunit DAD2
MSYGRPLPSHLRNPSLSNAQSSTGQSPVLVARINEKKAELDNLRDLQTLSAGLADQMQMLEEKLATLSDGTEGRQRASVHEALHIPRCGMANLARLAIAAVLSNWHNVLRAINMASSEYSCEAHMEDAG